jgi:RNA polymerase sigma-70 factor (ECF subfamily)
MEEFWADRAVPADASFEALTLPLLGRLRRYALRLTGSPAEADDLVQTAYLNALKGWSTFRPGSDPARWMFTILRHAFYRTRARGADTVSLEEPELESLSGTMHVRRELERGQTPWQRHPDLGSAIDAAIAGLPEELRVLVMLVDVEGRSYDEAATETGSPIGTVRSRLYRARRMLQERLRRHAEDLGVIREEAP